MWLPDKIVLKNGFSLKIHFFICLRNYLLMKLLRDKLMQKYEKRIYSLSDVSIEKAMRCYTFFVKIVRRVK